MVYCNIFTEYLFIDIWLAYHPKCVRNNNWTITPFVLGPTTRIYGSHFPICCENNRDFKILMHYQAGQISRTYGDDSSSFPRSCAHVRNFASSGSVRLIYTFSLYVCVCVYTAARAHYDFCTTPQIIICTVAHWMYSYWCDILKKKNKPNEII